MSSNFDFEAIGRGLIRGDVTCAIAILDFAEEHKLNEKDLPAFWHDKRIEVSRNFVITPSRHLGPSKVSFLEKLWSVSKGYSFASCQYSVLSNEYMYAEIRIGGRLLEVCYEPSRGHAVNIFNSTDYLVGVLLKSIFYPINESESIDGLKEAARVKWPTRMLVEGYLRGNQSDGRLLRDGMSQRIRDVQPYLEPHPVIDKLLAGEIVDLSGENLHNLIQTYLNQPMKND